MIECTTIKGEKKAVTKERLNLRVSVYAITITKDRKVLLITSSHNKKYFFPGGGLDLGENLEESLKRELIEETGIDVEVSKFIDFKETYFYYDPLDIAFQNIAFFYLCKPKNFDLLASEEIKDADAASAAWVAIDDLQKDQMFTPSDQFFDFIKNYKIEE